MLFVSKNFRDYLDFFKGSTAVLVGCGPTKSNYNFDKYTNNPIFFLNDAVFMGDKVGRFFHSHHTEVTRWDNLKSCTLFPVKRIRDKQVMFFELRRPKGLYIPYTAVGNSKANIKRRVICDLLPSWILDKDYIAVKERLLFSIGSITSLIHFIWFCGIQKIIGIGINPEFITTDHDPRIPAFPMQINNEMKIYNYCPNLPEIIWNQVEYFKFFNMEVEYI